MLAKHRVVFNAKIYDKVSEIKEGGAVHPVNNFLLHYVLLFTTENLVTVNLKFNKKLPESSRWIFDKLLVDLNRKYLKQFLLYVFT